MIYVGHGFEGFGENEDEVMEIWELETRIVRTLTFNFLERIIVSLDRMKSKFSKA